MSGSISIIIPFRDRGIDPRRGANLEVVMAWWYAHGLEAQVVDDGRSDDEQFNRHAAYNKAVSGNSADVFVFAEADMLIHPEQIAKACSMAFDEPGLVVPFTQYRYLSDAMTSRFRDIFHDADPSVLAGWWGLSVQNADSVYALNAESTMDDGRSIGAVNVVSAKTLAMTGGFTEATHGNWYDDRIIEEGFKYLSGHKTRFVEGPAVHLYHLPGWKGDHLSMEDMAATSHNRNLLVNMRADMTMGNKSAVRKLMATREDRT